MGTNVLPGGGSSGRQTAAGAGNVVPVANNPNAPVLTVGQGIPVGGNKTFALAQSIDAVLKDTPMKDTGQTFVTAALRNDVDPWFVVSIAGVESQWGKTGFATNGSHNPFGLGVTGKAGAGYRYPSWNAAIEAAANNLGGSNYKGAGKVTPAQVGSIWAEDKGWPAKVVGVYNSKVDPNITVNTKVIGPGRTNAYGADSALDAVKDGASAPWDALLGVLKFITNPAMWVRVALSIAGFIIALIGVLVLVKGSDAGRPFGFLFMGAGISMTYAAVRNINPLDEIRALLGVGAK